MGFHFRPATREGAKVIIGISGPSGAGKTFSALRLATGLAGGKRFAMIDTEAGRANHYADRFAFDHGDLAAPFSPDRYLEAIRAADAEKYPVIVVDSFTHEHSGEGGVLDWQEQELQRLVEQAKSRGRSDPDWKLRDVMSPLSWQAPKRSRKKMIAALLQIRAHLIVCLRAESKIEFAKDKDGKTIVREKETLAGFKGWIPICGKELPYEFLTSLLLLPDKPGIPRPIKLEEDHKKLIPLDRPLDEKVGEALAKWASGGEAKRDQPPPADPVIADLISEAETHASDGTVAMKSWWGSLTNAQRRQLAPERDRLKQLAEDADAGLLEEPEGEDPEIPFPESS